MVDNREYLRYLCCRERRRREGEGVLKIKNKTLTKMCKRTDLNPPDRPQIAASLTPFTPARMFLLLNYKH